MAEFDPVEWWNENARRFDHRIEKCGDNSNASDALRALAAEARRRAMEEAAALCRKKKDEFMHTEAEEAFPENVGIGNAFAAKMYSDHAGGAHACAVAIERAKGEG